MTMIKYEHEYASYRIPAPVLKDPASALEDAAGDLTTSHTLVRTIMGKMEGLQELERALRDRPGSISPEAWKGRADEVWALAEVLDARLKDAIILIYAIVDANNEEDTAARQAA
jgi:hypothetical protein